MDKQVIAVIGSGTMGNGIAHVSALSGHSVFLLDINKKLLSNALDTINSNLNRQLSKGIISEESKEAALNNIKTTSNINDIADSDLVIEAVPEKYDLKASLFIELDSICKESAILASNTSSISITSLSHKTNRPDKVIGMHFMNPVPIMKLVEIINTVDTSKQTTDKVVNLAEIMGKIPVQCNDYPGFVSNRILMPMINESILCLEQGVATKEAIDDIMKLGMAHPMGPLKLADLIGLDVCLNIMEVLFDGFKDEKYKPCSLLVKMVEDGALGRKSGLGFYKY